RGLELLKVASSDGKQFFVYESPGGLSLSDALQGRRAWSWSRFLVTYHDLLELKETQEVRNARRLWIDREARLRVLDFEVGEGVEPLTAFALAAWKSGASVDPNRPQSADQMLDDLMDPRRDVLITRLHEWIAAPARVTRRRRASSLLLGSGIALLGGACGIFMEVAIEKGSLLRLPGRLV